MHVLCQMWKKSPHPHHFTMEEIPPRLKADIFTQRIQPNELRKKKKLADEYRRKFCFDKIHMVCIYTHRDAPYRESQGDYGHKIFF